MKLICHCTLGAEIMKSGDAIICCRGLVVQVVASRNSASMELCGVGASWFLYAGSLRLNYGLRFNPHLKLCILTYTSVSNIMQPLKLSRYI